MTKQANLNLDEAKKAQKHLLKRLKKANFKPQYLKHIQMGAANDTNYRPTSSHYKEK